MRNLVISAKKLPSAITTRPIFTTAKVLNRYGRGLDAIEAAAGQCLTSLTATAIRFAELSDMAAHSDASGRSFRQHPVSHSGVSGHLRIVAA